MKSARFFNRHKAREKNCQKFYNVFKSLAQIYALNYVSCNELESFLYKLKSENNLESIYHSSIYQDSLKKVWKPNSKDESFFEKEINTKYLSNLLFCFVFSVKKFIK